MAAAGGRSKAEDRGPKGGTRIWAAEAKGLNTLEGIKGWGAIKKEMRVSVTELY